MFAPSQSIGLLWPGWGGVCLAFGAYRAEVPALIPRASFRRVR